MTKVTHVKAARKRQEQGNTVVEVGESYYWWKFRHGPKKISKTYPKPWQLTQSEFLRQLYQLQHRMSELTYDEFTGGNASEIVEEIRTLGEEQQEKLDNMPDSLQYSPSGETLQERADACESWATELEEILERDDWSDEGEEPDDDREDEPDVDDFDNDEDYDAAYRDWLAQEDEYHSLLDEYESRQSEVYDAYEEFKNTEYPA